MENLNGYLAFFNGKQLDVRAASSYAAQQKAIAHFKPAKSKAHLVSVHLCEKAGAPVIHSTASL